jgi:trk system potassium uptake protein TrkH
MQLRFVAQQLGLLLLILSACMVPSAAWSIHDFAVQHRPAEEDALVALLLSATVGAVLGTILYRRGREAGAQLRRREALLLVALAWVVGAALSATPFRVWAAFHDFADGADPAFRHSVNCYFEAMSGLTTTGASTLTNIESIPRSLLFWRAFTHWLGGLGIVVLFVAVLPILGVGGKRLFRFEAPGPSKEGVRPRIRAAARVLWAIYMGLTLAEILALKLAGFGWCDAMCHAFATMATGGFSTQNESIAGFANVRAEFIIVFFMILAGVNFGLYDRLLAGRWREVLANPELRAYLGIMLVSALVIAILILPVTFGTTAPDDGPVTGWADKARSTLFTVVSIQTTTGFCTADFDEWPFLPKGILIALMFVGGCGGSTGGGIKVIRFVILIKVLWVELETVFRPNVVRTVRVGTSVVDPPLRSATLIYFILIGAVVIVSTAMLIGLETPEKIEGLDHGDPASTAFSAVVATLNNIGPGLDLVGPSRNYEWLTSGSKLLLCLLMAMGRLELYAFLVLVRPDFWREK